MRLLLLNPNTTEALTGRLAASARTVLPEGVTLETATATRGFPYISSRAEAQVSGAIVLEMLAERAGQWDAAIIAAFGDPGLLAARELFDRPVTGMAEAAMISALSLGQSFAFVTFTPRMIPWYEEQVRLAGLTTRFAGSFVPDAEMGGVTRVADDMRGPLVATCRAAARQADVLILSGAPIAGLAAEIADEVPAVLIDPIRAAVMQGVAQARLAPRGAWAGSMARPPGKDSTGLPEPLAHWVRGTS
ncbi:aspartate/glutamate racemase family protein [Marinibacterium sp. SX1]|uniref:aspartate/glutamate racemase family protein n=1 Tax=Marinibacterium sp. SX1 TaxID=3388424 RepID=UPI003D16686A